MPRPDRLSGPSPAGAADIDRINRLFSDAFTDRYQRDGMSGVRVPLLNPAIWRFAIDAAGEGAMVWHDAAGEPVAFNMVHRSGSEGWMGPLAVRPGRQGEGIGALIVRTGVEHLQAAAARTIGLETMPRTVENIGFYSALGFRPEYLTVSMTREIAKASGDGERPLSRQNQARGLAACAGLSAELSSGLDFSREITLTLEHGLGDVTLVSDAGRTVAFALWHSAPMAAGRPSDELRVLKLVARDLAAFRKLLGAVAAAAHEAGAHRITVRCQTAYREAYGVLLEDGYRVHWTDLRMTLEGRREEAPRNGGIVFSNWEI